MMDIVRWGTSLVSGGCLCLRLSVKTENNFHTSGAACFEAPLFLDCPDWTGSQLD